MVQFVPRDTGVGKICCKDLKRNKVCYHIYLQMNTVSKIVIFFLKKARIITETEYYELGGWWGNV